ncbi:hypothetical protein BMW23_1193 [Bodo saltans virus]|uniref:Uncharacterized protein n=1 Tax=Bodo saltans virus TaxID=2024608 RepID=A0A2H4UWH0_9VIRU|nr:hypothetical protein QJ851_gp1173 [Bodo saltans virus]ATZ81236.1 hypothetical protein BMW23_1193 [Bodo saltans virus]
MFNDLMGKNYKKILGKINTYLKFVDLQIKAKTKNKRNGKNTISTYIFITYINTLKYIMNIKMGSTLHITLLYTYCSYCIHIISKSSERHYK